MAESKSIEQLEAENRSLREGKPYPDCWGDCGEIGPSNGYCCDGAWDRISRSDHLDALGEVTGLLKAQVEGVGDLEDRLGMEEERARNLQDERDELYDALCYIAGSFIKRQDGRFRTYGGPTQTLTNIRIRANTALERSHPCIPKSAPSAEGHSKGERDPSATPSTAAPTETDQTPKAEVEYWRERFPAALLTKRLEALLNPPESEGER